MIVKLNGIGVDIKRMEHVGPLLIQTDRGELKCHRNDYVVKFADGSVAVIPSTALDPIIRDDVDSVASAITEGREMTDSQVSELFPTYSTDFPDSQIASPTFNALPMPRPDARLAAAEVNIKEYTKRREEAEKRFSESPTAQGRIDMERAREDERQLLLVLDAERNRVAQDEENRREGRIRDLEKVRTKEGDRLNEMKSAHMQTDGNMPNYAGLPLNPNNPEPLTDPSMSPSAQTAMPVLKPQGMNVPGAVEVDKRDQKERTEAARESRDAKMEENIDQTQYEQDSLGSGMDSGSNNDQMAGLT